MPTPVIAQTAETHEQRLLSLIAALVSELRPQGTPAGVIDLDSALDRDLGFDSLSRVELMLRIERTFGVSLPERLLGEAESPRDILRTLRTAPVATGPGAVVTPLRPRAAGTETAAHPAAATTLVEALQWHVQRQPGRQHVVLYDEAEQPAEISYRELHARALTLAAGLQRRGLEPGRAVAIMLPTGLDYLGLFFAVLLAGGIPVPIYPPARASQLEEHLRRHAGILNNAQAFLLVTVTRARTVARLLTQQVDTLREVVTCAELEPGGSLHPVALRSDDIAFLQYTSGSTGAPKGVVLTHAELLANIRAMGAAIRVRPGDIFASWLPLYHDMGLIGAWLGSLYFAMPLVLMSPLAFLAHPARWLQTIHRHRATLSAAPNFAYQLCLDKVADDELEGLDLSSWRYAFNGAEPVSPQTARRFCKRFARCGLRPGAMAPVYGLAEAAVGLAFPPPGRAVVIDRIRRDALLSHREAQPARERESDALELVACGQPLPGYQIRVVEDGRELPERREGQIQFRGPSATSGYYHNPEASRALFDGDWLNTGDRGYIAGGDIFLTSRTKDVVIRAGRNLYPYEVEAAVGDLPGIRQGCVAMFGGVEPRTGTERVVVVAETHESDEQARASLRQQAMATATGIIGMPPDEIVLAPPQSVLKTSSGKIRRAAIRQQYEAGRLCRGPRPVWWQFARLAIASVGPRWRRTLRWLRDVGFATRGYTVFWLLAPPAWLAVVLLPGERLRWFVMRRGARLLLRLAGIPLTVIGLDRVPRHRAQVFAANHSSYLDGVALAAALPVDVAFVTKGELARKPVPSLFLRRIGARFVERFDWRQGAEDARRMVEVLRGGRSLIFFPEGTLIRAPGLLPFHLGAFMAATEAGVPVTPLVLRGTRSILRAGSWFPHRGTVRVEFGEPLPAGGSGWEATVALCRATREQMLANLREPDLAAERPPI